MSLRKWFKLTGESERLLQLRRDQAAAILREPGGREGTSWMYVIGEAGENMVA